MAKGNLSPRAFLKAKGLDPDKSPAQLDRAFLKSFPTERRPDVEMTWTMFHNGFAKIGAIYSLPETEKQAALLFSHDFARLAASLDWFAGIVGRLSPASIIELGCGAGYLLRYLRHLHPSVRLAGIDRQQNLLSFIPAEDRIRTIAGNYNDIASDERHDLVISDFGWDNSDMPVSRKPHGQAALAGLGYCPGCSDDLIPFFEPLVETCQSWCTESGHIAIVGRIANVGVLRALYLAASAKGCVPIPNGFDVIRLRRNRQQEELFPALIFARRPDQVHLSLEDMAAHYADALR